MSIIHPHFEFPSDQMPIELDLWWRDNAALFIRLLTSQKYHKPQFGSSQTGNLLIYPPKCNIKENILNGRKPKRHGSSVGSSDGKSTAFRWINIQLTSEDIDILEGEEASLEQLAYAFIGLGVRGLGLSVKYDSARKSYSVSIYGPDSTNNMQPCGISGAAPDLRDALLVSLYRFNNRLQGSFDGCASEDTNIQPKRFF